MNALKKLDVIKMAPFGSRVVGCATEKSDYDYLVLVKRRPTMREMHNTEYLPDAGDPLYGDYFSSWRFGDTNLVFTDIPEYFKATMEACEFCRKYKVYDKDDRCLIHEKFRDAAKLTTVETLDWPFA